MLVSPPRLAEQMLNSTLIFLKVDEFPLSRYQRTVLIGLGPKLVDVHSSIVEDFELNKDLIF